MQQRRAKGEGAIGQYKSGPKQGKWFVQMSVPGRRSKIRWDFPTQRDAKLGRERMRSEVRQGKHSEQASRETLSGFFEAWLLQPSSRKTARARNTVHGYRSHFKVHVAPRIGAKKLGKISQEDILDITDSLTGQPSIRQAVHRMLRAIFKSAVRLGYLGVSPLAHLSLPQHTAKRWAPLTIDQQVSLLSAVRGERDEAAITLALDAGVRQGELLGLMPEDFDSKNRTITVGRQLTETNGSVELAEILKTRNGYRTIELSSATVEVLLAHRKRITAAVATDLLFPSYRTGGPQYKSPFLKRFKGLLKKAGLPPMPFHYLRHTAATRWLQQGVPVHVVSRRLGHASIEITLKHYAHVMPGQDREAADQFDRMLAER